MALSMYALLRSLQIIPEGYAKSTFDMPCVICAGSHSNHRKTLHIDFNKNLANCLRCGTGFSVVTLYGALRYNIDPQELRGDQEKYNAMKDEVYNLLKSSQSISISLQSSPDWVDDPPVADISTRDIAYNSLLDKLSLSVDNHDNLIHRGLREQDIIFNKYKTAPVIFSSKLASSLRYEGIALNGVPGFFRKESVWTIKKIGSGFYVPVRDLQGVLDRGIGYIQGFQVRLDNPQGKAKYLWLSSKEETDGTGAETWCHFCGYPEEEVLLTEGPLKADIIHRFTNQPCIGVPGVNSLKFLPPILQELKKLGVKKILTAFDMDYKTNPHVQKGYNRLISIITANGLSYERLEWDEEYKGYDDFLLSEYVKKGGTLDSI